MILVESYPDSLLVRFNKFLALFVNLDLYIVVQREQSIQQFLAGGVGELNMYLSINANRRRESMSQPSRFPYILPKPQGFRNTQTPAKRKRPRADIACNSMSSNRINSNNNALLTFMIRL